MHLTVYHATRYRFESTVPYGMQHVRICPRSGPTQTVLDWNIEFEGVEVEATFNDHNDNQVHLVRILDHVHEIGIHCKGHVDTIDKAGIVGPEVGCAPPWFYKRTTALTEPGPRTRKLVEALDHSQTDLEKLHQLSRLIAEEVRYTSGQTDSTTTAEEGLERGVGVCQDHAHIFTAASRLLGLPARYVSGYLLMDNQTHESASHAWAETYVEGLGWISFDVSNGISPDERYIRIATGLDYREAAPIFGIRFGGGLETLNVEVQIQQ